MDGSTVLNLIFAFINILVAGFLLRETKKLREAETEPELSIYLQQNPKIPSHYDIVVKNIGRGPAYNLSFDFDKNADLIERQPHRKLYELGFFQGVEYLAPNQEYKSLFGGQELLAEPHPVPLKIRAQYKNKNKKKYSNDFCIDPLDFWGTSYFAIKTIDDISKDLNEISKAINGIQAYIQKHD
jgi:hypothetical protein